MSEERRKKRLTVQKFITTTNKINKIMYIKKAILYNVLELW
jgi:hypothetical protein